MLDFILPCVWLAWGLYLINKNREKIDTFHFICVWILLVAEYIARW